MLDFVISSWHGRVHFKLDRAPKNRDPSSNTAWLELRRIPIPPEYQHLSLDQIVRAYANACALADSRAGLLNVTMAIEATPLLHCQRSDTFIKEPCHGCNCQHRRDFK